MCSTTRRSTTSRRASCWASIRQSEYNPPEGAFHIDILTRLGEAFAFSDLEIERVPYEDLTVSVASPRTLYAMKKDTVRPKDQADAEMLRCRFTLEQE